MTTGTIVAIIVVVVVAVAVIAIVAAVGRRRRLQQRFGPEYDRAVADTGSRRLAEAELAEREKRVKELDIRPLDPAAKERYAGQWTAIQQQFVDGPENAIAEAQTLIAALMNERGYPTEDTEQIMADLSVDHAATLRHFRTAQDLSARAADGAASTEDMRQAMVHYRMLFRDLLGEPADAADTTTADAPTPAETTQPDEAPPSRTVPSRTVPSRAVSDDAAANGTAADESAENGRVRTETEPVPAPRRPQER